MDLFDVAKSCVRRWYVLLPLLATALFITYNTYTGVKPVYIGTTTLGLTPPSITAPQSGNEIRSNALLTSGGVTLLSNLLALGLSDATVKEQVAAQGGLREYDARVFSVPGGQLPLVVIESTSPSPDLVTRTLQIATDLGATTLRSIQERAGVPPDQMLTTYPVSTPGDPVPALPSRTRSTVSMFVATTGVAVFITVLVDVIWSRRRSRRGADSPTQPEQTVGFQPSEVTDDIRATTPRRGVPEQA